MYEKIKEYFQNDVKYHEMSILHNEGLYRHLRFKNPKSYNMYFDLITFPGGLLVRGDMGCWEFERIEDMFEFFRREDINPHYWAEKIQSDSRFGRTREFKPEIWKKKIREYWEYFYEYDLGSNEAKEVWSEIEGQILDDEDSEYMMTTNIMNFDVSHINPQFGSFDMMESLGDGKEYTQHYIWICCAIVWAIGVWDRELKERP